MVLSSILSTASNGLQTQARRAHDAAEKIVRQAFPVIPVAAPVTAVKNEGDLSVQLRAQEARGDTAGDISRLIEAEAAYKASAETLRTADDLLAETLDLVS